MDIRLDDLSGPEIAGFLEQHLQDMRSVSPPESKHALDINDLKRPDILFWTAWLDLELVGCGAIKRLDAEHGEIKSMRTSPAHRGRGVASSLLTHILHEARQRGFRRISLETGAMPFFAPACSLYRQHGFTFCPPFADYAEDPNSLYMSRML
ncbi:GNAT family N-acetyltransferase [Pseudomonas benzenivorans]|uniref:GNAT family N-acetyltransferase n=1 Tax=Pseudomonas benzenivorans TaxID=556533 RepID=UPI0035146489